MLPVATVPPEEDEELNALHAKIMEGGYGIIHTNKIMISGNIELLKTLLMLPAPVRRKTREQHLKELEDETAIPD